MKRSEDIVNIQGTVQISIQQFDELRKKAEEADKYKKQLESISETLSEGACMFLYPDSKKCAEEYGEGPDAETEEEAEE